MTVGCRSVSLLAGEADEVAARSLAKETRREEEVVEGEAGVLGIAARRMTDSGTLPETLWAEAGGPSAGRPTQGIEPRRLGSSLG